MFEYRRQTLLPKAAYYLRLLRHALLALVIIAAALGLGVLGYHGFAGLSWVDAIVNAAMILGGMGPVSELHTVGGKLFAAGYALFSGLLFLVIAGVLFAPVVHRFLHKFHLDGAEQPEDAAPGKD